MTVLNEDRTDTVVHPTTGEIIELVSSLRFEHLPPDAVEVAKHCFLDWLGVAIGGCDEPLVALLREQAQEDGVASRCTLVGRGRRVSLSWAALINGAASHALDYDDVVSAMGGHPSVPVLPAALALAQVRDLSGADFINAFVAGFETECRVGAAVSPGHYARGFHATGTVGTFGAAAACAHLLGLDPTQWRHAFGLAAAQAAGLKCMFGTMTKPFHAGKASANGLLGAMLASRGFTANTGALEATQGFIETQSDGFNPQALAGRGERLGIGEVMFKYHAACYLTHATVEAIQALQREHRLDDDQLETLRVDVPASHLRVCNIERPVTGLEGKFSLRFTAALAFCGKATDDTAFTDSSVADPRLRRLSDKVRVVPVDDLPNNYSSRVEILCRDGVTVRGEADVSRPASASRLPAQWARLSDKFRTLVVPVLGEQACEKLIEEIAGLDRADNLHSLIALINASQ